MIRRARSRHGPGLARERPSDYIRFMPLPRPSRPSALWADLRAFASQRPRHQWLAATIALAMPVVIIVLFILDGRTNIGGKPEIIYAESWSANRTDAEIKADQAKDQAEREAAIKERQRQFKKLSDNMEKLGI